MCNTALCLEFSATAVKLELLSKEKFQNAFTKWLNRLVNEIHTLGKLVILVKPLMFSGASLLDLCFIVMYSIKVKSASLHRMFWPYSKDYFQFFLGFLRRLGEDSSSSSFETQAGFETLPSLLLCSRLAYIKAGTCMWTLLVLKSTKVCITTQLYPLDSASQGLAL